MVGSWWWCLHIHNLRVESQASLLELCSGRSLCDIHVASGFFLFARLHAASRCTGANPKNRRDVGRNAPPEPSLPSVQQLELPGFSRCAARPFCPIIMVFLFIMASLFTAGNSVWDYLRNLNCY